MQQLLFYKEPRALNREQHKRLRFSAVTDFSFTKGVNSVPLMGLEFFEASRDLPVLFSRDGEGNYFPLALLSLMNDGHKLVTDDGVWRGHYVPAFIRRYPFALTDDGTVCFDGGSAQVNEKQGDALFDESGENTQTLNNIITFLNEFEAQNRATREFCAEMAGHDLFKAFSLQVMQANGTPLRLDGLFIIDEEKVAGLDDETVLKWFRSGRMAWIYAHLHSLGALKQLSKKQTAADSKAA